MIFVTLGTHPQPMQRLVPELARVARELSELGPFHAQVGATEAPVGWERHLVMPPTELADLIAEADIVITHGGPATIAQARALGRIPVVVPRRGVGEHVDDHQIHYARRLAAAEEVVLVEDEAELVDTVRRYRDLVERLPAPTAHDPTSAIAAIARIAERLFSKGSADERP